MAQSVMQYKCPNCAAELRFNPKKQGFSCEYCESFFTTEECKAANAQMREEEQENTPKLEEFANGNSLYVCPSCGAEIIADQNTSATECYYCHNPVVLKGRLSGEYRPSKVLPFKLTRSDAESLFKAWCKKRKFLPKTFTSESQLVHMAGVYVPFWVADCHVDGRMRAVCKKVRSWTSGSYQYTETKEFDVYRSALLDLNGIPADGASKIEDALMEAIEPFDYSEVKDFEMAYLSGFLSDKYDVNKSQVFPRIRNRAVNGSDQLLRSTMVGYDSVRVTQSEMQVLRTSWQYMLLPVWFMTFDYKGKQYAFAINGQSGKQAGTPPLDTGKLLLVCALIVAASLVLGFLGGLMIA